MKRLCLAWFAVCLVSSLQAQQPGTPPATPPPLPPPPWLKRTPDTSQWLVSFAQGEPGAKPGSRSSAAADGTAKKTIVVTKNPGLLSETTARVNGAVIRRLCTPGLFMVQVSGSNEWMSSTGSAPNGFNETDYRKHDFAGFDWISAKNYVGVQEIAKRPCLVFSDKVVTIDQQELDMIHASVDKLKSDWQSKQELKKQKSAAASPSPAANRGKKNTSAASAEPTPVADEPAPPAFNLNDYLRDVTAYIDVETGLPALLTYKTQQRTTETRTYTYLPEPTTPLTLPPEAQALVDTNQQRLQRMAGPAAIP